MRRVLAMAALVAAATGCSTTREGHPGGEAPFQRADSLFAAGDYAAAAEAYETRLARQGDVEDGDAALLRLAVLYLAMGTPRHEPMKGERALRRLVERYPSSPFRESAEYILSLRRRIEELEEDVSRASSQAAELEELEEDLSRARSRVAELERRLEELKRIDLERPN